MHYVGLDVHQRRSSLCILDANGKTVNAFEVKGNWTQLLARIARDVPRPFAVCYEASCGYGHLFDRLRPLAARVAVAHPGRLRLIFASKKKNDRVDAQRLAKLLYLDEVPAVHVPSLDVRAWRALIEFRQKLVARRVAVKNQIRTLLRGLGVGGPPADAPFKSIWTRKGTAWLKGLTLDGNAADALRRDLLVEELTAVDAKVARVEKELARRADAHPGVRLLTTIPGVGVRTAEAFVAYVDDPARFARANRVGSYLGLVPCQDSSADVNRLGHITRDGPATVRKLLTEAAWQSIRRSPSMRGWFERVTHDDPGRKKIALVATAHRLARVMAAMLRTGETWREETTAATTNSTPTPTPTPTTPDASPPEDRAA
jgi:transposase